jgi:general secretion pathway protein L
MARWLGIDVGSKVVRVALLRTGYGRPVLEALREVWIDPDAPGEPEPAAVASQAGLPAAPPAPEPAALDAAPPGPAWLEPPGVGDVAPDVGAPPPPVLDWPPQLEPALPDPLGLAPAPPLAPTIPMAAVPAPDTAPAAAAAAPAPVPAAAQVTLPPKPTAEAAVRAATAGLKPDALGTAIDGARGFLRRMTLPAAAQKELNRVLSFEVESTLPFELEDAVMDHRVLGTVAGPDGKRQLHILCAVALTQPVRERIDLVAKGTGLQPERVGMGVLPLANLMQVSPELRKAGVVGLLEIEADHTDLLVLAGGEPQFARSLSRGAASLPEGTPGLLRELRQTIAAWRLEGGNPLDRLCLCGSGRDADGLAAALTADLELPVVELALPGLDGLGRYEPGQLGAFTRAIALGLGLSRRPADLNLRRGALAAQQTFSFLREKTPLLAGLLSAIVVSLGFSIFAEMRGLDTEHTALAGQLAVASRTMLGEETRDPEHATELLDRALSGKSEDPLPEMDAFGVMVELSKRVPKEINHDVSEFDFNRGTVVIRGIVNSIEDGQAVAAKMAEHPCFHDVKIARFTKLGEENKQKYQLDFTIKCEAAKKPAAAPGASGSASVAPRTPSAPATSTSPTAPPPTPATPAAPTKPGAAP